MKKKTRQKNGNEAKKGRKQGNSERTQEAERISKKNNNNEIVLNACEPRGKQDGKRKRSTGRLNEEKTF